MSGLNDTLARAMAHHKAGRLSEAHADYSQALRANPKNSDAHNLLGLVLQAQGKSNDALKSFDRALQIAPHAASAHFNRANVLTALKRFDEAQAAYEAAIKSRPDYADALLNLGALLHQTGKADQAAGIFRRMVLAHPHDTRGHFNLARCLIDLKQFSDAESLLDGLVDRTPKGADVRIARAQLYADTGRLSDAIKDMKAALQVGGRAEQWSTLGDWLAKAEERESAIAAYEQACAAAPDRGEFLFNLGNSYYADGQLERAAETFKKAIALTPNLADARINLGQTLSDLGRYDEAIVVFEGLLKLSPSADIALQNLAAAQNNQALALLASGAYEAGWENYRRRHDHDSAATNRRPFTQPFWRGEELLDKKILLWTDQGLGDEILYSSMIPDITARAGQAIIECSDRLVALFQRSFPSAVVVPKLNPPHPATLDPSISYQSSVPDLGGLFRLSDSSFPAHHGYLISDATLKARLRSNYVAKSKGRPILGISWKSENLTTGKFKTVPLAKWEPILRSIDAFWVSLQYGEVRDDVNELRARTGIDIFVDEFVDQTQPLDPFAAQIASTDLVISVSNTAVHFAGALNVPAWTVVPRGKGCLWYFRNGSSTPWYPSLRLYQQHIAGDWSEPIQNVVADLKKWSNSRPAQAPHA